MAEKNPPSWLQGGSHAAENDRLLIRALLDIGGAGVAGIVNAGDLAVTANGTPNMSVNVATGSCFVPATEVGALGTYHCHNEGSKNLAVAAADATNPRIDLVVARVRDAHYSGAINAWSLEIVQGVAAASPAVPTTPASSLVLARVAVAASASSITSGNITSPSAYASEWQTYVPVWTSGAPAAAIGNGTLQGRYRRRGRSLELNIRLIGGSTTTWGGTGWSLSLPPGIVTANNPSHFQRLEVVAADAGGAAYNGMAFAAPGASAFALHPWVISGVLQVASNFSATYPFAWGSGDSLHAQGLIEVG